MITSDPSLTERLSRLIDDNLDNPAFSSDRICQELGISRSQLYRYVKEETQLSLTLFVRQRRLEMARFLLKTSNLRISEIADRVGINNPQNFSKYFTESFGISPSEFRRSQQGSVKTLGPTTFIAEQEPMSTVALSPVVDIPGGIQSIASGNTATHPISPRRLVRWTLYAVVLTGLVFGLSIYIQTNREQATRPTDTITTSLAVLPLSNIGSPDTDPICDGLMDDIHTGISLIRHLRVIARASSDRYRRTPKSISQIRDDLRVDNILRGKMLKSGNQVLMKIELINAKADRLIWAKTYRVAYQNVFELTEQIAHDVARELELENNPSASEKLALARTKNIVAYNNFLQGRQLVITRKRDNLLVSLTKFDRALALDPTFAEAHAFKGVAYSVLANSGYSTDPAKSYELAQQNALKAIQTDPTNSTAYGVLGTIYADTYQWQAAETSFRIALQYNPNDAQINYWYSLLLRSVGRLNEAIPYSTQALAIDPLYPVIFSGHILNCAYANRFDLAQATIKTDRAIFDDSFTFHMGLGLVYLAKGDYRAASASFARSMAMNPQSTNHISTLMYCEAKRGNQAKAIAYLQTLTAGTARTYYDKAVVFAGLSRKDSSLFYLKKAADLGYIYKDIKVFPPFQPYRSEPVFQAILRQYRFPANP